MFGSVLRKRKRGVRLFLVGAAVLLLSLGLVGNALADNGVHGSYTATTDKCAACHRTHTAQGVSLLKAAATATDKSAFCYSCHSGGFGAYTDVRNGLFLITATVALSDENTSVPASNRPLRGGGFENVRMNPDLSGSTTLTTTSSHMVGGGSNTVWGFGSITSTVNVGAANVALTCTNCHNPHGGAGANQTATYRILKGGGADNKPLFSNGNVTPTASVDVPDESAAKAYYIDNASDSYFAQHGASVGSTNVYAAMTGWCAQCHTRYMAPMPLSPGSTDSGDAVFRFRHGTNKSDILDCSSCHYDLHGGGSPYPGCMTCHVAHGTGVRMQTYSGAVSWPGGGTVPNGNARGALLRLDNRGVCQQCHNK